MLEVGCGTGWLSILLAQAGVQVTVLEAADEIGGGTRTEELTAAFLGWPVRTFEAAVNPQRLGWGWAMFAYRSWQRLSAVDRVLGRVLPQRLFYNVLLTGTRP